MAQGKPPERPRQTREHRQFNRYIASVARGLVESAVILANENSGPLSDHARSLIIDAATDLIHFTYQGRPGSRAIKGTVAGSDSISCRRLVLPSEAMQAPELSGINYPGRILSFSLNYAGSGKHAALHTQDYRLYTGPNAPPIIVDEKLVYALSDKADHDANSAAGVYLDILRGQEGILHFPEEEELVTLRTALRQVPEDIDMAGLFGLCLELAEHRSPEDAAYEDEAQWFLNRLEELPPSPWQQTL